jgi:autotransporter-associated beta strand protein
MTLGYDSIIDVAGTQLTISTAIGDGSNGYGITKQGAGTLVLSGTNTFSGDLTITTGTVTVSGTLADTVDVINSGTYNVNTTDTINSLSGAGAVAINTGVTLTTGDAGNDTISGIISGAGNLTKTGAGILTLTRDNTFSGDLTITTGTVTVSGTLADTVDVINSGTYNVNTTDTINSLSGAGAVAINTGVTLTTGDAGNDTISGIISGAGNLTKTGAGTLILSNNNSYTGDTTISNGTIKLTGAVNAATDLIIASGATLDLQATQTFATLDLDGTILDLLVLLH